jgi:hypothetical protein
VDTLDGRDQHLDAGDDPLLEVATAAERDARRRLRSGGRGLGVDEADRAAAAAPPQIFVESWSASYGTPMQINDEDESDNTDSALIEGEGFGFVEPQSRPLPQIAFIDGRRRQEAALSQMVDHRLATGIAGAYAVGAVIGNTEAVPRFERASVKRVVIWPEGLSGAIPDHPAGWSWACESTPDATPAGPMKHLQELMRRAEAALANDLAQEGFFVLLDGTLTYAAAYQQSGIAGYVKTHHRRLLPEPEAAQLPGLPPGYRTTLFRVNEKRYGCYLRLAPRDRWQSPMASIIRLEFAGKIPIEEVRTLADGLATLLPRHAGVAHVDPRAPQNLQPIGALESHLGHLMGDIGMAERAIRDVIARLSTSKE